MSALSGWTEDHQELRAMVHRFLEDKSPTTSARTLIESASTREDTVWEQMASQLGLHGLIVAEELGGAGLGPVELGIVLEEMGRVLLVAPFFSSIALAAQTLACCRGDAQASRWLPRIADGSVTATVAAAEHGCSFAGSDMTTTAARRGSGWVLSGSKSYVVDGSSADLILVVAAAEGELAIFAIDTTPGEPAGLTRTPQPNLDPGRALARVDLDEVAATRVGGATSWARALDLIRAAIACEQVGVASRALEMAVDHAKTRVQFDRPIGSFQAIKHQCADLLIEVEAARSAAFFATALLADDDPEGPVAASVAHAWCSTSATHAAKANIQIHGGLGYTWEHDAHLFLKRAKASEHLFGSPSDARARVAELVGI